VDRFQTNYPPASGTSYTVLSESPFTDATGVPNVAHSSIYRAPSGAWVFSAGTTSWSWGLDDFARNLADPRIQRATANVLNAFLNGAPVKELAITAPTTIAPRKSFAVSIEAKDSTGSTATWYTGTVHFSSSDTSSGVVLPPDTTLTNGQGTFSVTLATEGSQTVTVTDPALSLSATASITVTAPAPPSLAGLHVQGNRLVDPNGQPVVLHGVARSGTEYACIQGTGIFDGPNDAASIAAIKSWGINAVRVPLNEDCWLGINGVPVAFGGAAYQQAVSDYVSLLNENGLYAIVDLHWSAPGTVLANMQQPMPDMDHSPAFWSGVASAFGHNNAVILELFNEPFPDGNQDSVAAWTTWRDGGTAFLRDTTTPYQAAGMQTLVDAVRATGATNVIALGGVQFSNSLTRWLEYKPTDPLNNLAAAWHIYNFNACSNIACFDSTGAPVAAQVPLVVTETGMNSCDATFSNMVLGWLDARDIGYLAWAWNTWGNDCATNALIIDYAGTPTTKGEIYKAHVAPRTDLVLSTTSTPIAGTEFSFTVTARDQYGDTDAAYAGTLHFTSSDTSDGVVLPPDSTLSGGQGTFAATLRRAGSQTITATDSATGSITGTLTVVVRASSTTRLELATTDAPRVGTSFSFTVTAVDQFGNTDAGYAGAVRFTSSDTSAGVVLPADSTLTN
ncbi:MAG TPA: cellulase family glycosylhydrolase, partial [Ilumatobacter sp.]|nr:cellulase family glycosylhydrolase [Ilumatobacter sp.]